MLKNAVSLAGEKEDLISRELCHFFFLNFDLSLVGKVAFLAIVHCFFYVK